MAIIGNFYMLKDSINRNKNLLKVSDFLESCLDFDNFKEKKSDYKENKRIDLGDGIFAILQTYTLKSKKKAFFETHRKYVDFQLTISGYECFLVGDSGDFKIKKEYDSKRDLVVYKSGGMAHRIYSAAKNLCIFMPNDVHAGGLKGDKFCSNFTDSKKVYKIVVKIPIELINLTI